MENANAAIRAKNVNPKARSASLQANVTEQFNP